MNSEGLRIGITIGLREEAESMWVNGIKQNAVYLAEALRHVPDVRSVRLVNTTAVRITAELPWDQERWPTVQFADAKDDLDILIELGGQIDFAQTEYIKQRGTRLVSYCCGFEYVIAMESVLFDRPLWGHNLFVNLRYDALWVIPQVADTSLHFFQTLRRCPAQVVPFVWDPVFLNERSQALPHAGEYRPRTGPRRLSVMEPNHDVVKFCLYPILIAEEAFRHSPEDIQFMHVTNAEHLATNSKEFVALMNQLSLVQQQKISFVKRFETPQFLSEMTDVVVSHQWGNPLNYFYLEVCWQGYPLVHNASLCPDLGYYYEGNDVQGGSEKLLWAMASHDASWQHYLRRQRQAIGRYLPGAVELTEGYRELLARLMQQPLS